MRIIPLEVSFELWSLGNTFEIQVLHFDWPDFDTCLIGGGWNQGDLWFDLCFWRAIRWRLLPKISERFEQ